MERNSASTESKFKSIIYKSDLIKEGSPSLYKLTTKVENVGTLRRVTFGRKDMKKTNKTILLVGETGTGKSTLINSLVNYTMGVKFEDDVWFQIVEDEERSQSESQTSDVIIYEIFGFENQTLPFSLTIIDTPGYGNTKQIEADFIVSQRLFDLFRSEDGVHEVDVVGLVMKATENRLSERLLYIFNSVMSLFGKDIEQNIIALITHSDGLPPKNALEALDAGKVKCAKKKNNEPVYFLFNNCQNTDRTDETMPILQNANQISMTGMETLKNVLIKVKPQKLETTVEVLNSRIRLVACIQNLQDRIHWIELKQDEIKHLEENLKKHEQEIKMNKNFSIKVDEVYKDKETIDGGMRKLFFFKGAVCCTHCEENCHFPGCTMAWYPSHCKVMEKGRCIVCTSKCLVSAHVKENWRYVPKTRKVQKTVLDMKEKYEKNQAASAKVESLLGTLYKQRKDFEADKEKWLNEAYQHVEKLNEIALNVQSLSTYVHLDFLIKNLEGQDNEKCMKLKEMTDCKGNVFYRGMNYFKGLWNSLRGNQLNPTGTGV